MPQLAPVDPSHCTDFNRSEAELQKFWLFCIFVANKNADATAIKLEKFLKDMPVNWKPFDWLKMPDTMVMAKLEEAKVGQYNRIYNAIADSCELRMSDVTLEQLEAIHGVGPKTARYFLVHTREDCPYAVLDTHILAWMRGLDIADVPKVTPSGAKYRQLERLYRVVAKHFFPGWKNAEIDLHIWRVQSGRISGVLPGFESETTRDCGRPAYHAGSGLTRGSRLVVA